MREITAKGARPGGADLYNAWYYYTCFPREEGDYLFFSTHTHLKTNWPTPGMVPNGLGVQIHTVRLMGLKPRLDENDPKNWLRLQIANREDPCKWPPWLLYENREVRLPFPIQLTELQMFLFRISIEASPFSIHPDKRPRPDLLTLFIGVTEARSF